MKFIGSTSTVSFIPVGNLNFFIIFASEFCIFKDLLPLISNLILNFLLSLNIGALTGPRTLPTIAFSIKLLNLYASFSSSLSLLPVIIKATKVDGVYSEDPILNSNAVKYPKITFKEVLDKELKVMDMTAVTLCKENNLPIIVFNINDDNNIIDLIDSKHIGTLVS